MGCLWVEILRHLFIILSSTCGTLMIKLVLQWFAGALLIVIGVVILSKSSVEPKANID